MKSTEENKILHEIFCTVSSFPRYISCYYISWKVDFLWDSAVQVSVYVCTVDTSRRDRDLFPVWNWTFNLKNAAHRLYFLASCAKKSKVTWYSIIRKVWLWLKDCVIIIRVGMGSCSRHVVSVVDGAGLNSVISRSAVQATHVPRAW